MWKKPRSRFRSNNPNLMPQMNKTSPQLKPILQLRSKPKSKQPLLKKRPLNNLKLHRLMLNRQTLQLQLLRFNKRQLPYNNSQQKLWPKNRKAHHNHSHSHSLSSSKNNSKNLSLLTNKCSNKSSSR